MNAQEREILKGLIHVVWADGQVDDRERELLGQILVQLGFNHKDLSEVGIMMTEASFPDLQSVLPDHESRLGIMKVFLAIGFADGALAAAELRCLNGMARELGISSEELQRLKIEAQNLGA
ncbi:MAG: TerB family tellurite resistance protein [Armatimonadetes bacterium]|nr:TerB family tellurite resistance protein [Armatimonadota bacterium]